MGGILSSPKPPALPPQPEPAPDTGEADAAKARLETLERRRRGRAGTILTSERGLVRLLDDAPATHNKTLLGE